MQTGKILRTPLTILCIYKKRFMLSVYKQKTFIIIISCTTTAVVNNIKKICFHVLLIQQKAVVMHFNQIA